MIVVYGVTDISMNDQTLGDHMEQRYAIQFISDDDLPAEHDWALIVDHGRTCVVMKCSRVTPRLLEEAWLAYRQSTLTPA